MKKALRKASRFLVKAVAIGTFTIFAGGIAAVIGYSAIGAYRLVKLGVLSSFYSVVHGNDEQLLCGYILLFALASTSVIALYYLIPGWIVWAFSEEAEERA